MKIKPVRNRPIREYRKASEPLYKVPKSTQQLIDITAFSSSGIFTLTKEEYSKTYAFTDIGFTSEDEDRKEDKLIIWCEIINKLRYLWKLHVINLPRDVEKRDLELFMQPQRDIYDPYRQAYNAWITSLKDADPKQHIEQSYFLTITIPAPNFESAKSQFAALEAALVGDFKRLGSILIPLTGEDRLTLLHTLMRPDKQPITVNDVDAAVQIGRDLVNDIAPISFNETEEDFSIDEKKCRMLYASSIPNGLPDDFITRLASEPWRMIITVTARAVPKVVARPGLINADMAVDKAMNRQQQLRNQQGLYSSDLSYDVKKEKMEIEKMLSDMDNEDQMIFFGNILIALYCDTDDDLEKATKSIMTIGDGNSVEISVCVPLQQEAWRTALPIGINLMPTSRLFTTQSVAAFHPFNSQTIYDPDGVIIGLHQLKKDIVRVNRKNLTNGNGWVLGGSGSGKSMLIKNEVGQVQLATRDYHIILDPLNEYSDTVESYGGSFIPLSADGNVCLNAMEIPWSQMSKGFENGFISSQSELVMTIAKTILGNIYGPIHNSLLDDAVQKLYQHTFTYNRGNQVSLMDLMEVIREFASSNPSAAAEAREIIQSFTPYTTGTMSIFSRPSNISTDNRLIAFGCRDAGKQFRVVAMEIVMNYIKNLVLANETKGIHTRVTIDEAHEMMRQDSTAEFLINAFKEYRHHGALVTGVTQNLPEIMRNDLASTMIRNSEYVVLMKQKKPDRRDVMSVMDISEAQLRYVIGVRPGTGLLKAGEKIVPFDGTIPEGNLLYRIYNTDPAANI